MLLECHTCAKGGTKTTFETLDELKGHICGMHCGNIAAYLFMCQHCQHICESEVALLKHTKMCKSRPRNVETIKKLNRQLDMHKLIENSVQQSMTKSRELRTDVQSSSKSSHQHRCANLSPVAVTTHLPSKPQESGSNNFPESSKVTRIIKSEPLECPQTLATISNNGGPAVNGIRENTETRSDSGQTCSPSAAINLSVKIEPTELNDMDTSEVEVLGEVHVRKRKRQSQLSDIASKSKSKPEEIKDPIEEDIIILGQNEAVFKTKPTHWVTFMQPQVQSRSDRNLQHIAFGNNGFTNPGVPSSATPTVSSAFMSKKSKKNMDSKRTVAIYGTNSSFSKKMLKAFYSQFGHVGSITIQEREKGKKIRIGYITFATEHQCNNVIAAGPKLYNGLLLHPTKLTDPVPPHTFPARTPPTLTPPQHIPVSNTPILSATRIRVKGICVSTSPERKLVEKYLRSYFGIFGAIERIDFDMGPCGATISFKSPATADLCLQQYNHTICGKVCEVKRAKLSKTEKKQLNEALQKNVPAPQAGPGSSTATNTTTLNISPSFAAPNESNSVSVSGLDLDSIGARCAAKMYLPDYFEKFGKVIYVALISDSEANIIFRDSTSVEKCLQTGTINLGDRECKVTRSSVPKSTILRGKNQWKKVRIPALAPVPSYPWQQNTGVRNFETSDPRLPYHAGLQPHYEMPYVMPFNAVNFNANLNYYHPHGPHGYEDSWGQSTSFGSCCYPTYSSSHLPYNPSLPLHYQMPTHGPAMLSYHGNDNHAPPPGPSTSYYHPTYGRND